MSVNNTIIAEIMKHMPTDAEKIVSESLGDYTLSIFWKLKNDSERPNKYSKTITIFIPRELIDDFSSYPVSMQQPALAKLNTYISNKLSNFNPDHDVPKYGHSPVEKWDLPIEQIFC
jgi:hypothetical protein